MPGISGQAVKRELERRGIDVRVVLMSSDPHLSSYALADGYYDYLRKPFALDQMEALVARVASEKNRPVSVGDLQPVDFGDTERLVVDQLDDKDEADQD
jgi:DNA-binding NtrC family response regulator